jgi:hypothetical protein
MEDLEQGEGTTLPRGYDSKAATSIIFVRI